MTRGEVPGNQRPAKGRFFGGQVKGLYDIQQGARTLSEPSISVAPPPSKRHRLVPTIMVSSLIAQECEDTALDPSIQELEGVHQNKGPFPFLSSNQKKLICPLRWHPYVSM